jgi:REP element-mobilizing transposase RayT
MRFAAADRQPDNLVPMHPENRLSGKRSTRNYLCVTLPLACRQWGSVGDLPQQISRERLARSLLLQTIMRTPLTELLATNDALDVRDDIHNELKRLYGDEFELLAGGHHARYLRADVPFHVISRIFQGRHLLRPGRVLNRIIAGVVGRAQTVYPTVDLFAYAFLSNHVHMMLRGPTRDVVCFIGFVKREISRRWGAYPGINWPGTMWHGYLATALPTADSQLTCFKYILSQGVKEGLVAKPQLWPGVHSAKQLLAGTPLAGEWFDATAYAVARDREARRLHPQPVSRSAFFKAYEIRLSPIAPWVGLSTEQYRERVRDVCDEIEAEGRIARRGRPPIGARTVQQVPLERRSALPALPWLSGRRRMICWADPRAPETREYVNRYWEFQRAFRAATLAFVGGDRNAEFPAGAFPPPVWPRPGCHAELKLA